MPAKIFREFIPCPWHNAVSSIGVRKLSSEDETGERKRQDVAAGRTTPRLEIDFCGTAAPNEDSVVRCAVLG